MDISVRKSALGPTSSNVAPIEFCSTLILDNNHEKGEKWEFEFVLTRASPQWSERRTRWAWPRPRCRSGTAASATPEPSPKHFYKELQMIWEMPFLSGNILHCLLEILFQPICRSRMSNKEASKIVILAFGGPHDCWKSKNSPWTKSSSCYYWWCWWSWWWWWW